MFGLKKNRRRATYIGVLDDSKKGRRAARKAGERLQRADDRVLVGKVDQSDPHWADRG